MNNPSLVSDPWTELIDSFCLQEVEVDPDQPLASFEEYLAFLKKVWSFEVLTGKPLSGALKERVLVEIQSPFAKMNPVARALSFILAKKLGILTPPLVPMQPLMPLFHSMELSLLWSLAGLDEEGRLLGEKIFPLISLPTLWCEEKEFCAQTIATIISLFRRSFGLSSTVPGAKIDPYFLALAKLAPRWSAPTMPHHIANSDFGLTFLQNDLFQVAVTLAGERSPLGAFSAEGVEVRAFGPQEGPLSEVGRFGILRVPDSQPMERWTAMSYTPEVWLEVAPSFEQKEFHVSVRFLGLKVETPTYFVFYVKASKCEISGETLLPGTLQRYRGDAKPVLFDGKVGIQNGLSSKMEVIPLAGRGGLWDADFLLAFEVSPFEARGDYFFILSPKIVDI